MVWHSPPTGDREAPVGEFWLALLGFLFGIVIITGALIHFISPATFEEPSFEPDTCSPMVASIAPVGEQTDALWLAYQLHLRTRLPVSTLLEYTYLVVHYGNEQGLDPRLLTSMILVESYADPNATSSVGARGLLQVMPSWWQGVYPECGSNLYRPATNVCYAARILRWYLEGADSNLTLALNRYSGYHTEYGGQDSPYSLRVMSNMEGM